MSTSGIYKLTFTNGDFYIGKSANIERRMCEHRDALHRGEAAAKLQKAYYACHDVPPNFEVLLECHPDHIDLMEAYYIRRLRPKLNSTSGMKVSDVELDVLIANKEHLKHSTATFIMTILNQNARIYDLEEGETIRKLRLRIRELEGEKAPWYKRMF